MVTKRQKEVLNFIKSHKKKKGYAPSLDEVKKHLKLLSVSTAHYHIKKLEGLGFIEKKQTPTSINNNSKSGGNDERSDYWHNRRRTTN